MAFVYTVYMLHVIPVENVREYALAGNSTITVQSKSTEKHFTFKIRASKAKPGKPKVHFVSVLTGPNNKKDYTFFGTIFADGRIVRSQESPITDTAPSVQAFRWMWRSSAENLAKHSEVFHHGRCARCGRKITNPDSLKSGYGPECAEKLGF